MHARAQNLRTLIPLCAALTLASALPASAQTDPRAATHADNGNRAMTARDNNRALSEYVLAYVYEPTAQRLLDVGRAYEAIGNRTVALEIFERVVAIGGTSPAGSVARQRVAALGGGTPAVAQSASIQLTVMPPGAEIYVDGKLRGRAPLGAIAVSPGAHRVEVHLQGYKNWVETISATGKGTSKVVSLTPGQATPPQVGSTAAATTAPAFSSWPLLPTVWRRGPTRSGTPRECSASSCRGAACQPSRWRGWPQ